MKNPKFIDYRVLQLLLPRFGKKNFETLVDQEFHENYEKISAAETAFFLEKFAQEKNLEKQIDEQNLAKIVELEEKIAEILFRMERTGVRLDTEKLAKI